MLTKKQILLRTSTIRMNLSDLKNLELLHFNTNVAKSGLITLSGKSCGIFGPHNRIRIFIKKMVDLKYYDMFVMILIGISSFLLMLDNPLND